MANTKIQSEQIADDVALAGSPTTTTQSASDNSTKVATTAYVTTAVANLVDSAPSSLDTLNELAAAMNDNASFFSTVLPLSGGTMTGDLILGDNVRLEIGSASGGDLQIYHTGSASVIADTGDGSLFIQGESQIVLGNVGNIESYAVFNTDGAVQLRHNNAQKFTTTTTGIEVTGSVDADDLILDNGTITSGGSLTVTADANPSLEISRGSANTTNVNLKYNTTLTGQLSAADEKFQISAAGSGTEMELYTAGQLAVTVDTSQNLGIGTAPATKFDVMTAGANQWYIRNSDSSAQDNAIVSLRTGGYSNIALDGATVDLKIAGSSKVHLDANGDLIVGGASSGANDAVSISNTGYIQAIVNGDTVGYFNRRTSDGEIIRLQKDGSSVGSLFTNGGALIVKGASTSAPVQLQTHDGNEDIEVDPDGFIKFETAGSERFRIESNITFNGVTGTSPIFELINNDNEDVNTGRETSVRFSGHRSGGEDVVNAQISGNHVGSADDDKGGMLFYTNGGSGLGERMRITNNEIIFNEDHNDQDLRVESDANDHAMFLDASREALIVGHTTLSTNVDSQTGSMLVAFNSPGSDNEGGHIFLQQHAPQDTYRTICSVHDAGATGITFLLNATRNIDQNRHRTALVRYAYNQTFTEITTSEQNTTIEYRVDGSNIQYRFTSAGDYVVQIMLMAGG